MATGLWVCYFASPGTGKTTLAAGAMRAMQKATGRKSLYVDFDGSAEDIPAAAGEYDLFDPTPPLGTTEVISNMRADAFEKRAVEAILKAKSEKPPLVVFDTVTTFGDNILLNLPRPAYAGSGTDRRPWYGEAQTRFRQWMMWMPEIQRNGTHVLWLCHETSPSEKGDKGGPSVVSSGLTKTVSGFPRMVLRVETVPIAGGTGLLLKGGADNLYMTKDRLNAFPSQGISITVMRTDASGKDKPPAQFEEECIAMGEKVWRTFMKAQARRAGVVETAVVETKS